MPRLFGRLQYLAAMALELKTDRPLVQLLRIWSPFVDAMLALEQEMKQARLEAEGTAPASPPVPETVEAILAPIADVLGIPRPVILRALTMGPAYRSLPETSPANRAASAELLNAYHGHAEWMERWGLPRDDIGWCVVTIYWGALWSLEAAIRRGDGAPASPANPDHVPASDLVHDRLPDLALFYPNHFKERADLFHTVEQPTAEELAVAIGRWAQDLAENMLRTSASVTVPSLTWNPWLESRAAAETRLGEAAERAIKEQLDTTAARLAAAGAKLTPRKSTGLDHFRWLVRYQIKMQSHAKIAARLPKKTPDAVRMAIHRTAKLIGLPLRPQGLPGAPRGPRRVTA
jgi:hypothetical protein